MPRHRKRSHYYNNIEANPMTPGQKIFLVGGGLALGGLLISKARAASKVSGPAISGCNPSPYSWNEAIIKDAIETVVEDGETNPLAVATAVADAHFGDYPGGGNVSFPPDPNKQNPAGVDCVWSRVTALVDIVFDEKGIKPGGPEGPKPFEILLPWLEDPDTGGTAKDGKLFRVRSGWILSGTGNKSIAHQVLVNAGIPSTPQNRVAYLKAIECGPWNDALSGYPVPEGVGGHYAPSGRGITFLTPHADNMTRMMQGLPPRRSIKSWTSSTKAASDGTGGHLPLVWLPGIEHNVPTVILASYNDGFSAINPPKEIMAFGLENVPPGNYGCAPYSNNAQPLVF